ncbi:hypothetical protein ACFWPA_14545 [Rhodococcus sp. NPDC058505]|uniref:hypothetical protein n=1 Tax=Rhodococcus sp. NPDC058505 TaxID=3346531 RepID=UPI003648143D
MSTPKVVFLHGVGDGDPDRAWLTALNTGLYHRGFGSLDHGDVVAPRYDDLLMDKGSNESLPGVTYKSKDDSQCRRRYEQRQAWIQRQLQKDPTMGTYGFGKVADPVAKGGAAGVVKVAPGPLKAVQNYVERDGVRGAVMTRILKDLDGLHGDVVLVAHSLGSVIALDLLDHLPDRVHVRRFVTIGSPAHSKALHKGAERLLKKFPYSRVDDWSNFFCPWDPVTMGRGLAWLFPAAQDFLVRLDDLGPAKVVAAGAHDSVRYLRHESIAGLIGQAVWPTPDPTYRGDSAVAAHLGDGDALRLLVMQFNRQVALKIADPEVKQRFGDAAQLLRDADVAVARQMIEDRRPVPAEWLTLAEGRMPSIPLRWSEAESVRHMAVLATANSTAPYEIDCGDAPLDALPNIAMDLGLNSHFGVVVRKAIVEVRRSALEPKSLRNKFADATKSRWLIAAAGLVLVAAAPIGLMVAAPVGVAGGAAIVGALAGFGPGGMVGGIAAVGGLASTGAMMATVAATVGSTNQAEDDPRTLVAQVAAEYALTQLNLPHDEALWVRITDRDNQINAEIRRLEPFSDEKSSRLTQLRNGHELLERLIAFMSANGLGPKAIPSSDDDLDAQLELTM